MISLSGGRMMMGSGGPRGRGPQGQGERPEPNASRMQEMQQRMLRATALNVKGRSRSRP